MKAFKSRRGIAFTREGILDANVVVEGMWPEAGIKVCTEKHRAKGISSNRLVSAFAGTILTRGVGTSGVNSVVELLEQATDFRVVVKFTTLVKYNIFVVNIRGVGIEPFLEPKKRRAFVDTGDAIKRTGVVIRNEDIARLTVDTGIRLLTFGVLRGLAGEGKINTKSLPRNRSLTRWVEATRLLAEFGSDASGTKVKDGILVGELGDAIDVMVSVVNVFVTGMTQTLVP